MTLDEGGPVVAELRGETVHWERLHLPTPEVRLRRPPWGMTLGAEPSGSWSFNWPTLCGLTGFLYRYAGLARSPERPFCSVCVAACNRQSGGGGAKLGTAGAATVDA